MHKWCLPVAADFEWSVVYQIVVANDSPKPAVRTFVTKAYQLILKLSFLFGRTKNCCTSHSCNRRAVQVGNSLLCWCISQNKKKHITLGFKSPLSPSEPGCASTLLSHCYNHLNNFNLIGTKKLHQSRFRLSSVTSSFDLNYRVRDCEDKNNVQSFSKYIHLKSIARDN